MTKNDKTKTSRISFLKVYAAHLSTREQCSISVCQAGLLLPYKDSESEHVEQNNIGDQK